MPEIRHYAWHFTPPTAKEFDDLLKRWDLSKGAAALLCDVTGKTIQRYALDDKCACPFPILYVLASECANVKITKGGWRVELNFT
jgi:hypothetical protein